MWSGHISSAKAMRTFMNVYPCVRVSVRQSVRLSTNGCVCVLEADGKHGTAALYYAFQ